MFMKLYTTEMAAIQTMLEIEHWQRLKILYHGFIPWSFLYTTRICSPALPLCLWLWGTVAELVHAQGQKGYTLFRISRKAILGTVPGRLFHLAARLGKDARVLMRTMSKVTVMQEEVWTLEAKKMKAEVGGKSSLKLNTEKGWCSFLRTCSCHAPVPALGEKVHIFKYYHTRLESLWFPQT